MTSAAQSPMLAHRAVRPAVCMASIAVAAMLASTAHGAHPMATEDAATQGAGHVELETGYARTRDAEATTQELGPQLSYGIGGALDLIVRPTLLDVRGEDGRHVRGLGDTALDVKWRFLELPALELATRAGVSVPTGSDARGLGTGRVLPHVLGVASFPGERVSLHANVGYARAAGGDDQRRDLWHVSGATVVTLARGLRLTGELLADSPPTRDERRWANAARIGAIVSALPTLDLDVGLQHRLGRTGPERVLLAGATVRW